MHQSHYVLAWDTLLVLNHLLKVIGCIAWLHIELKLLSRQGFHFDYEFSSLLLCLAEQEDHLISTYPIVLKSCSFVKVPLFVHQLLCTWGKQKPLDENA